MVRRVKAYLVNMKVITDEERLHALSVECEPHAGAVAVAAAVPLGGSRGRRHPSPTLSTTSSASSTSENQKSRTMLLPVTTLEQYKNNVHRVQVQNSVQHHPKP